MNHQETTQRRIVPVEVGTVIGLPIGGRAAGLLSRGSALSPGVIEGAGAARVATKSSLLVLLDIGPSGMSEIEAFQRLHASFPNLLLQVVDSDFLPPGVRRRATRLMHAGHRTGRTDYGLTPHETRLLKLMVEGHSYKTAAVELGVTAHTVDFHLRNVYGKLQVHSKSEAISKALRDCLVL